ncbi:hypothetical protein [Polaromonas sp.]|uniref:hypothetical protein n=1 Tax=Polaromonas sp. TaxID=1869339 RepID=UPI00286D39E7|nr:hypothetical protein [Polaromonas sp.]
MFKQLFKSKAGPAAAARSAASVDSVLGAESLNYLSTGYSALPQLPPLQVSDIWQNYRRGALTEQDLLMALSKRVAEFQVPYQVLPSKFDMATLLAQSRCDTQLDAADAIDALLDWADEHAIDVVDGAGA